MRGREAASRLAHNQKIVGSSPTQRNQITALLLEQQLSRLNTKVEPKPTIGSVQQHKLKFLTINQETSKWSRINFTLANSLMIW